MEKDDIKKKILEDVDPQTHRQSVRKKRKDRILVILEFLGLIVGILLVFHILLGISTVQGNSMYPTLHSGDKVLYYRRNTIYREGDIVALRSGDGEELVKRIVAVAGDTVNIQNGKLYVNGTEEKLSQIQGETLAMKDSSVKYPLKIEENQVFVLGDNREISSDSRTFGPVSVKDIEGKIAWYIGKPK